MRGNDYFPPELAGNFLLTLAQRDIGFMWSRKTLVVDGSTASAQALARRTLLFSCPEFSGAAWTSKGKGRRVVESLLRRHPRKGKPAERPGRKARERNGRKAAASPAAEGMVVSRDERDAAGT